MADRVLPSLIEVRDYLTNDPPVPTWMQDAIVEKYAAGRLVDREAMDYEAMADRVLRDHSEPCEHGDDAYQWKQRLGVEGPLHWDCRQGGCPGGQEVPLTEVTVVFDGPPGPKPGRFIEVENPETGESIKLGKWYEVDGLWYLAFDAALGQV